MSRRRLWLRTAVSTLLMLSALVGTAALGIWQYSVAHRDDVSQAVLAAPPVAVSDLLQVGQYVPESSYGRAVRLAGQLDCGRGFQATQLGRTSPWLVCPLRLNSGGVIAVVLGLAPAADAVPPAAAIGELAGRLQPAQSTEPGAARYAKRASVDYITTADLALRWQSDVFDGYVLADRDVSAEFALAPVPRTELVLPPAGIQLRNLFYAWQWWIFAGFAVFIWGRYLRDEWRAAGQPAELPA